MINFNKKLIVVSILLFFIILCFPVKTFAQKIALTEQDPTQSIDTSPATTGIESSSKSTDCSCTGFPPYVGMK
jgi:hypothetical protein